MQHLARDVRDFHQAAGITLPIKPEIPDQDSLRLSAKLVLEEVGETLQALYPHGTYPARDIQQALDVISGILRDCPPEPDDLAHLAKEIIDSVVVLVRMGLSLGLPLQDCWDEVHRSNMAKFPGGKATFREDGKVIKPADWQPPDLKPLLKGAPDPDQA